MPRLWTPARARAFAMLCGAALLQGGLAIAIAAFGAAVLDTGSGLSRAAATLALCTAALLALRIWARRAAERLALGYVQDLRAALLARLLDTRATGPAPRLGITMARLVNDLSAVRLWIGQGLAALVSAGLLVLVVLGWLAVTAPGVAFALLPGLLLWCAATLLLLGPLGRAIRTARQRRGDLAAIAGTLAQTRLTQDLFGRSAAAMRRVARRATAMNRALLARATLQAALRGAGDVMFPATVFGLVAAAAILPGATGASPAFALILAGLVAEQIAAAARALDLRLAAAVALRRIAAGLGTAPEPARAPDARPLRRTGPGLSIDCEGVVPRPGDRPLSLRIGGGSCHWLDPEADPAARALVACLAGLATPSAGRIRIGGRDLTEMTPRARNRAVTLVSPLLPLLPGSLAANLAFGAPRGTIDAEIAAQRAAFDLDGTPDPIRDIDAVPPEAAARLRAARAVLRRARVVLIDDPQIAASADLCDRLLQALAAQGATVLFLAAARPVRCP